MQSRSWWVLGLLTVPALAPAQTVKEADVIGAWKAEVEFADRAEKSLAWLVLWPDGAWWYYGDLMRHRHGGARWRLVGDTLWLGNDYHPYFHSIIRPRVEAIQQKGYGLAVMDMDVIKNREPFLVPDAVYWSKAFRDSTSACDYGERKPCGTWVYHVAVRGQQLSLVRLDKLSRATESVATKAVLTRDSLAHCKPFTC